MAVVEKMVKRIESVIKFKFVTAWAKVTRARKVLRHIVKKWGKVAQVRLLHGVLTLWVHNVLEKKEVGALNCC